MAVHEGEGAFQITVEPVIILFMLAAGLSDPAIKALTYQKVCLMKVDENHASICSQIKNGSYGEYEDAIQAETSTWFLYQHLCFEVPALVLAFFYGTMSDVFSRRVALILPCIGQALSSVNYLINAFDINGHVGVLLVGQLISGLFGGWVALLMAAYSYISVVSDVRTRTSRISIGEGVESISLSVALFISGYLLRSTSYVVVFIFAITLYCLSGIYCVTILKEPEKNYGENKYEGKCSEVFNCTRVKEAIICVFKQRPDRGRTRLLVLLASVFFGMISFYAMPAVAFLFLKHSPLSWDQELFGIWSGIMRSTSGFSQLLLVPLLKLRFGVQDTVLLIIGLVSSSLAELFLGLSTATWMAMLVPVINLFGQTKYTCFRSLASQIVPSHELGKMFAMLGSLQSLSGMIGSSLYNGIYPLTLAVWPGFCFALGAGLVVIPLLMAVWLHIDTKVDVHYDSLSGPTLDQDVNSKDEDGLPLTGFAEDIHRIQ